MKSPGYWPLLACAGAVLAGCAPAKGTPPPATYEIAKDGIVVEEDKREYESLGDVTFSRKQDYTVKYLGKGKPGANRMLLFNVVVKIGNKDVDTGTANVIIKDGTGKLTCYHLYDVKMVNYDQTPDPVCVYTSLGEVELAPASVTFK